MPVARFWRWFCFRSAHIFLSIFLAIMPGAHAQFHCQQNTFCFSFPDLVCVFLKWLSSAAYIFVWHTVSYLFEGRRRGAKTFEIRTHAPFPFFSPPARSTDRISIAGRPNTKRLTKRVEIMMLPGLTTISSISFSLLLEPKHLLWGHTSDGEWQSAVIKQHLTTLHTQQVLNRGINKKFRSC